MQPCLEQAKELEERDEDSWWCATEEKVELRQFKAKWVSFYRRLGTTRPEDVVFDYNRAATRQRPEQVCACCNPILILLILFARCQEEAKKDGKWAFGVLQFYFDIVNRLAWSWKQSDVVKYSNSKRL